MLKFKASLLGIAVSIALVIMPALTPAIQSFGQEQQRGQQSQMQNLPEEQQGDDDVAPAPPSIGAAVPLTYFGPAPSTVQKSWSVLSSC